MAAKGVTFKGNPLTLVGTRPKAGDKAPDFVALGNTLTEKRLKDFRGKVKIISVTPSLDTGVCDAQARKFTAEAAGLGDGAAIINMSMDLPFASGRFSSGAGS